ncbi:MAG: hypothetical protein FWD01_05385 [Defluviitaleaceae bacterium]|nr:hypothetical protein [Defluviitaleaceae bacterium]
MSFRKILILPVILFVLSMTACSDQSADETMTRVADSTVRVVGVTDDAVAGRSPIWLMENFWNTISNLGEARPISHYGIEIDGNPHVFSHVMLTRDFINGDRITTFRIEDAPLPIAIFVPYDTVIKDDGSIRVFYLNQDGTYGESTASFVPR